MDCEVVADLNDLVQSGGVRALIRVNEALHERCFSQIADEIIKRGAKAVLLAGPSSSGKTTSANRLAVQLRVHGKHPILISLDDYYVDRDKIQPGPDGKLDLEHINTIDTALFRTHLETLLSGGGVELPRFSFQLGRRVQTGKMLKLSADSVILIEGLHGLNPLLLPEKLDRNSVFRIYVSPLIPLNLDHHNRIPTSYLRLLRRIQENADVIFNSSLIYELAVLKKQIFPLLTAVEPESPYYDDVRYIVKILNYIQEADVDDEIPPTSILREFIGGNSFYR